MVCLQIIGDLGDAIEGPAHDSAWPFNKDKLVFKAIDICEIFPIDVGARNTSGNT